MQITTEAECQTVITTFELTPGTCSDVLEALQEAYRDFIRHQPGFLSGALHVNDAQTRIAAYSRWRDRGDFQAMLRSEEMRRRNRAIAQMCSRFEPVLYDVVEVFGPA